MENLIFGAFATLEGYREGDNANLGRAVYDRVPWWPLCSAKAQNPGCTVALVHQCAAAPALFASTDRGRVEIWSCPLTPTAFLADTNWALAYYKLCAMDWVLTHRILPGRPWWIWIHTVSILWTTSGGKQRRRSCCIRCPTPPAREWPRPSPGYMTRWFPKGHPMC